MNGDWIFKNFELADHLYFIDSGLVEIVEQHGEKEETVIALLSEGSYFGENGIVWDGIRTFSARAKTICHLYRLSSSKAEALFEEFPLHKQAIIALSQSRRQ